MTKEERKIYAAKYYIENKEKLRKRAANHYKDNLEHHKEVRAKYVLDYPERVKKSTLNWHKNHPDRVKASRIKYRTKHLEELMFRAARLRASKKNILFSISINDIIIPEFCPILNIPLQQNTLRVKSNSPSLDRIIPEMGYTPENIQVISYKANTMKNNASYQEMIALGKWAEQQLNKGKNND